MSSNTLQLAVWLQQGTQPVFTSIMHTHLPRSVVVLNKNVLSKVLGSEDLENIPYVLAIIVI